MSIQLQLSCGVLKAAALFTSTRQGDSPNPNSAVHFRFVDEVSLRMACTNGKDILFLRLLHGSDRMDNFFWSEDERDPGMLSMVITPQLVALLSKAGPEVTLDVREYHVKVCAAGEVHEVQRLSGRQVSLFDDIDALSPASRKLHKAGQSTVNPRTLMRMSKAAKHLGAPEENLHIARLEGGKVYGIAFGSDDDLWFFTRPLIVTPPAGAGLPPEWAMSGRGKNGLEAIVGAVESSEDEVAKEEQASLPIGEEAADSADDAEGDVEVPDFADEADSPQAVPDGEGVQIVNGEESLNISLADFGASPHLPSILRATTEENLNALWQMAGNAGLVFLTDQIDLEMKRREAAA